MKNKNRLRHTFAELYKLDLFEIYLIDLIDDIDDQLEKLDKETDAEQIKILLMKKDLINEIDVKYTNIKQENLR